MARVPFYEIERLKRGVALIRVAESYGLKLENRGKDALVGVCPLHEGGEATLTVSPVTNTWTCATCEVADGSVVDFVMRMEGISFTHAVELLQAGLPSAHPVTKAGPVKVGTVRKLSLPIEPSASDVELLAQVVDYYHSQLKESPEALGYLERRGLVAVDLVDTFKLGFANRTLGYTTECSFFSDAECVPDVNSSGILTGPYVCANDDGASHDGCKGALTTCSVSNQYCSTDSSSNELCSIACTSDSLCGNPGVACCNATCSQGNCCGLCN